MEFDTQASPVVTRLGP